MNEMQFTSFDALFAEAIDEEGSSFAVVAFTATFNSYFDEDLEQIGLSFTVDENESSDIIDINLFSNYGNGTLTIEGEEQENSASLNAQFEFNATDSSTIQGTVDFEAEQQENSASLSGSYTFSADGSLSESGDLETESGSLELTAQQSEDRVSFDLSLNSSDGVNQEETTYNFEGTLNDNVATGELTTEIIVNGSSETETESFSFPILENTFTSNNDDFSEPETETARGSTVYRFYNPSAGVHFYTADQNESDYVRNNLENYNYEGESYVTVDALTGNNPEEVYRFFNSTTGVHLYTTDENERDYIIDNLDNFAYEDIKFYAYKTEVAGTVPIHRFYEPNIGVHFYTPNEVEKTFVEENLSNYTYEGIAYYAAPISDI